MREKKYGFIDKTGRFAIEPIFDKASNFSEGLAYVYVEKGDIHGYIDKTGKFVIMLNDNCSIGGPFHEGFASCQRGQWRGYIDRTGMFSIDPKFKFTGDFCEGLALIKTEDGYGYINKSGLIVVKPQFESASDFNEGFAAISYDNPFRGNPKCGYIDRAGRFVVPPKYKLEPLPRRFSEGLACVNIGYGCKHQPNDRYGFIDKTGRIAIEPQFEWAGDFNEGLALVNLVNKKKALVNKTGQLVVTLDNRFDCVGIFREGLAFVQLGDKFGYIDKTGTIVIEPKYEDACFFSEGLACVKYGGKYGYINKIGHLIIEPQFEIEFDFHEGLACVEVQREVRQASFVNNYQSKKKTPHKPASSTPMQNTSSGCYIATTVYGSYDCPQVWTLRRYRDSVLDESWYGRLFIRSYYAISPILVKWFGRTCWFRSLVLKPLNKLVTKLNDQGIADTPYKDKY